MSLDIHACQMPWSASTIHRQMDRVICDDMLVLQPGTPAWGGGGGGGGQSSRCKQCNAVEDLGHSFHIHRLECSMQNVILIGNWWL